MVLLNAESLRQEYAYLRKQINPHFLFNVLNNASILAFEDSEDAIRMFESLKHMLEYQFAETGKTDMTLEREMDFLDTYLSLEASRIDSLEYELSAQGDIKDVMIPTMIYITFVENAVKYSTMISGGRKVTVGTRCGVQMRKHVRRVALQSCRKSRGQGRGPGDSKHATQATADLQRPF